MWKSIKTWIPVIISFAAGYLLGSGKGKELFTQVKSKFGNSGETNV